MISIIELCNKDLEILCSYIRKKIFEICLHSRSGHIGGCSGAVELVSTLYFGGILKIDGSDSKNDLRDRVLVRGHLGPLRYTIFSLIKYIEEYELLNYRNINSMLKGHEDHKEVPGIDITPSGSLGMLLSYGVGSALYSKMNNLGFNSYVFIGDGEEQEGNVSEAARQASFMRLNNLIVIIDKNYKQLSNPVSDTDCSDLSKIWEGYGWNVLVNKDGNNINQVRNYYAQSLDLSTSTNKPTVIISSTTKGLGIQGAQSHFSGYHTINTCTANLVNKAIESIEIDPLIYKIKKDILDKINSEPGICLSNKIFIPIELSIKPKETTPLNPDYCQADYFMDLSLELRKNNIDKKDFIFLTADVTKQDDVDFIKLKEFSTFINVGIREQHCISLAHGFSISNPSSRIIINSFDAFSFRSLDQINASVQGGGSFTVIGDISGLTNSRNGKTHQTSSHPIAISSIPNLIFLEPADVLDTFNCLNWAIGKSRGIVYIRIYNYNCENIDINYEKRNINYYVAHGSIINCDIVVVSSGLTVISSISAAKILYEKCNIKVCVVNVINIKSLDFNFYKYLSNKKILAPYNGSPDFIGSYIASGFFKHKLQPPQCIDSLGFNFGDTGSTDDLLSIYGLDDVGIADKLNSMITIN